MLVATVQQFIHFGQRILVIQRIAEVTMLVVFTGLDKFSTLGEDLSLKSSHSPLYFDLPH